MSPVYRRIHESKCIISGNDLPGKKTCVSTLFTFIAMLIMFIPVGVLGTLNLNTLGSFDVYCDVFGACNTKYLFYWNHVVPDLSHNLVRFLWVWVIMAREWKGKNRVLWQNLFIFIQVTCTKKSVVFVL